MCIAAAEQVLRWIVESRVVVCGSQRLINHSRQTEAPRVSVLSLAAFERHENRKRIVLQKMIDGTLISHNYTVTKLGA